MSIVFKKIEEDIFLENREKFLDKHKNFDNFDLETAIRFHKSLSETKNFSQKIKKMKKIGKKLIQAYTKETLLEDIIENLENLSKVGQADILSIIIDSHTRENNYENAKRGLEDSMKANKSLLNGFPLITYGVKLCRKIVNDTQVPIQIKHSSQDARLLAEMSFLSGFSSLDGGGISHNIPFSKSVQVKSSIEKWRYVDRLVGYYEEKGVHINREIYSPLTATLIPPSISNSIQILETLLAVEQGVKNISIGVAQYGNIIQDIASLQALREQVAEYLEKFSFKDIEINTIFNQWIGGFPNDEMKSYSLISYGATVGAFSKADRIFVKNPEEYNKNSLSNTMINSLFLTRAILEIEECQDIKFNEEIVFEKELIKKETKSIIEKIFSLSENSSLEDGISRAFEEGIIDIPFAPSKYNLGKVMPARDLEGMIRYLDIGNLPFDNEIKNIHLEKLKARAEKEKRELDFQMTIEDIFASSEGKLLKNK